MCKKKLISVIVPVYNVEKYLPKCLKSIINQTYTNLEIILIDDGSTDHSGIICDEYAERDTRIKVVHKKNEGLSEARNTGLEMMKGDLVTFIDSDDWIDCNMINKLYDILSKYSADISCISFHKVFEDGRKEQKYIVNDSVTVYTGVKAIEQLLYKKEVDTSAWGKLYRKQDFTNIKYPKGLLFEDLATTYKILYGKKRIAYSQDKLYYYFQRKNSIMYQNFTRKRLDKLLVGQEITEWINEHEPNLYEAAIARYFIINIQLFREIPLTDEWKDDLNEIVKNIKKYRYAVIKNRNAKKVDRLIAASTYLGVYPLKILGKIYKAIYP